MTAIDYSQSIPNNVNLADDRRLIRALEKWLPAYMDWWHELGPENAKDFEVYLRTAIDVGAEGWAHFGMVKMPDYRWGIFLANPEPDRRIGFGQHKGEPAWQELPGEYRSELRRLIVTQGDTEPASVEQQRFLGKTCPSLYDLRSLFQVNVEEGRHLWAMVYLLHAHFGRDGREEAEEMLARHAGDPDKPRILEAFNEITEDWLAFFMFTYFQDRDGKFQLAALAESGFDPLSRSCRFMLTEEAHHMFVGETGVGRVVQRSAELTKQADSLDVRSLGGIDLPIIQKYINFHFSICLDLFGQELSTNAANYYTMGLKGRYRETKIDDDHVLEDACYKVPEADDNRIVYNEAPALNAINERLRVDFAADCKRGLDRWNKTLKAAGIDYRLKLPSTGFHRNIGSFAGHHVTPEGKFVAKSAWDAKAAEWLPTEEDRRLVKSLMLPVTTAGKMAGWIAPPAKGIHGQPLDFEYVRFH